MKFLHTYTPAHINKLSREGAAVLIKIPVVEPGTGETVDRDENGNFVHPIMKNANLEENLNYHQQFAVGSINDVSLNPQKGWRFDVEITDPQMKQAFKSNTFSTKYPRYVSPQIATFPDRFPNESNNNNIEHWHGIHLAFVDHPAYGFQKTDMKGKCYGSEQTCEVQLRSASTTTSSNTHNKYWQIELADEILSRGVRF